MILETKHIKQFTLLYVIIFLSNYCWLCFEEHLLFQVAPVFFYNKLDVTLNVLMLTHIHQFVITHYWSCYILDALFIITNLGLIYCFNARHKFLKYICIATIIFNISYCLLLSIFGIQSIEQCIALFFMPIIFYKNDFKWFHFSVNTIRFIFISIIVSAALWKLRTLSVFNPEQMSGILLHQHTAYLINNSETVYGQFIRFIINHTTLSFIIYLAGIIAELIFVIAYFTKKIDRLLIIVLLLFIVLDLLLMRINYFSWLPFMLCFYYSDYKQTAFSRG